MKHFSRGTAYTCHTGRVVASSCLPSMAFQLRMQSVVTLSSRESRFYSSSVSLPSATQIGGAKRPPTGKCKVLRAVRKKLPTYLNRKGRFPSFISREFREQEAELLLTKYSIC